MSEKTIVDDGASVTAFDAENIQTDREKRRDGMSEEDIRKGSWGGKAAPAGSPGSPGTAKDGTPSRTRRKGR